MANLTGLRIVVGLLGLVIATGFSWLAGYDATMVAGTAIAALGLLMAVLQVSLTVRAAVRAAPGGLQPAGAPAPGRDGRGDHRAGRGGGRACAVLRGADGRSAPALAVTLPIARGTMPLLPALKGGMWGRLVREALPVTAASAVGILYYRVAQILMSLVSTPTQTGYFGASFRVVVEVLVAVPGLLVTAAFPILARSAKTDRARLAYALQRMFDVGLLLGPLTAIVVAFGAEPGIRLIAGSASAPSADVLRIQGLALAATFLVATWGFALLSLRAHREIIGANALAFALATGLVLALAPAHGARGAAVAMSVTEVVLAAAYGVLLMRSRPELRVSLRMVPRVAAGDGRGRGGRAAHAGSPGAGGVRGGGGVHARGARSARGARGGRPRDMAASRRRRRLMHVGLNLVYLVPGETGGMEVAARELIPALRGAAPGAAVHGVREPGGGRADGGPWGELVPSVVVPVRATQPARVGARRAAAAARGSPPGGVDLLHSLGSTAPALGRFRARVDDPRPHLPRRARGALRAARPSACGCSCRSPARRAHRVIADSDGDRATTSCGCWAPPGQDRRRAARGGQPRAGRDAGRASCARASGSATGRSCSRVSAKRPHKNLRGCSTRWRCCPPERRPGARAARATRRRTRPSCARAPRRSASPATCASSAG